MLQRKHENISFNNEDWEVKRKLGQFRYVLKYYMLVRGLPGIIIFSIAMWFMGWNKYPLSPIYWTVILVVGVLTIISSIIAGVLSWQRNERSYLENSKT